MTAHHNLEARVHARMGETGETYSVARRGVLNETSPSQYRLRGGVHPETAAMSGVLANRGVIDPTRNVPLSEAMLLGIGGGLGAGYALGDATQSERRIVEAGFRSQWHDPEVWFGKVCERLGVPVEIHHAEDASQAGEHLEAALRSGRLIVAMVAVAALPYWHLPGEPAASLPYSLVVYGATGGRLMVDDRNRAPLTVSRDEMAAARARIPSLQHALVVPDAAACVLDSDTLAAAVGAGLSEHVEGLSAGRESYSLAALQKWSRDVGDDDDPYAWPTALGDSRSLMNALVSTYEALTEVGLLGGNLRSLYADFLVQAAVMTGLPLREAAVAYRTAADRWQRCAAVCASVPIVRSIVAAEARRRSAVAQGDRGSAAAAAAAAESARLMASGDLRLRAADRTALLADLSTALDRAYEGEIAALETLGAAMP